MTALLELRGVSVDHPAPGGSVLRAADGVGFEIDAGRTLGLVGESGSGKSTVGAAILGFTPVADGVIRFDGQDITHLAGRARRRLTRHMQIVFQDPYSSLNPARSIGQTLDEPLRYNLGWSAAAARAHSKDLLARVGLAASAADRYPAEFSGGQRQRVAIARAIAMSPRLVICDEPVSALDLSVQAQVLNLLMDLQAELGIAYVFISHDLAVVRHVADQIAVMRRGRIVERGPSAEVFDQPQDAYTRRLLLASPVPDPAAQRERRLRRQQLAQSHTTLTRSR